MNRSIVLLIVGILLIAAGYGLLGWMRQPARRDTISSDGIVASITYPPDGRSRPVSGIVAVKLTNGGDARFSRPIRCMPPLKTGDRVQIIGRSSNGGGMTWSIVGEPCPA